MSSYNYGVRGSNCSTQGPAITSNKKFYPPYDEVYYKTWVRTFNIDNSWKFLDKEGQLQAPSFQHINTKCKNN